MKTIEKIKEHSWSIIIILLLLLMSRQCSTNREISKVQKSSKEISAYIDSTHKSVEAIEYTEPVTREEIRYEMEQIMYQFLIYEDDIDKGKVSLSAIKIKMDKNEK